jgi:hypothetical protein
MHRMHRAAGLLPVIALLAACAAPGTGTGGAGSDASSSIPAVESTAPGTTDPSGSPSEASATTRVDIGVLGADPSSFMGEEITVLARVDRVLVDGLAFLTSPSATEENQMAVVVRPDAQVDKEIAEGSMVWVDGTVIGVSEDELAQAGVDVSLDELGEFSGEFAMVADAIRDPLAGDD